MSEDVEIGVGVTGEGEVEESFIRMGNAAGNMHKRMQTETQRSSQYIRDMSMDITRLGAGISVIGRLGSAFGVLTKEQADAFNMMGSIVIMAGTLGRAYEAVATASWAVTLAEKARAIAHAIAWALSGPWGIAFLTVATAASAVAMHYVLSKISLTPMQFGGIVTKPSVVSVAEREPEAIIPLSQFNKTASITINIYESVSPRQTGNEVILALRSAGVI